jgi:integrase/recombinase XerD
MPAIARSPSARPGLGFGLACSLRSHVESVNQRQAGVPGIGSTAEEEGQALTRPIGSSAKVKLLFYTAVRVQELVRIQIDDVDLGHCRIFIQQGKGPKDRYILFPASFRLVLRSHMKAHPENQYLFESTRRAPFTTRRIQQIVQSYRVRTGLTQPVHPHLFRHQMLTYLTAQGLSDAQLQLISGHASKKSLEVYQHLSLEAVEDAYQAAVRILEI